MTTRTRHSNPRFLAYCRAHGADDPEEMLAADRERWPGGHMCGFTLWVRAAWEFFKEDTGERPMFGQPNGWTLEQRRRFDGWLAGNAGRVPQEIRNKPLGN